MDIAVGVDAEEKNKLSLPYWKLNHYSSTFCSLLCHYIYYGQVW
jgi:hypothetical protein